jgi:hypothetical protein
MQSMRLDQQAHAVQIDPCIGLGGQPQGMTQELTASDHSFECLRIRQQ